MKLLSTTDPEAFLQEQICAQSADTSLCFAVRYGFVQEYLPGAPEVELVALISLQALAGNVRIAAAVLEATPELVTALAGVEESHAELKQLAERFGAPWLNLSAPLPLLPVAIAKPWGREIWYTGIESRGQSGVGYDDLHTPLPWVLSLAPGRILSGATGPPLLLKILDPLPDEVYGDLYFEMHEEKREVYLVTHVDETAWPDGVGGIRFGFDQDKRAQYADDAAFKAAYLAAVRDYEAVRREIDGILDQRRDSEGVAENTPLPAETLRRWQAELAPELREREQRLRRAMESFTAMRPLRVGDVLKVPRRTPHALQHGVRTVEFQTPVYERMILSFAQKVLTQSHWDTSAALEQVDLVAPAQPELAVLFEAPGVLVEQVAVFDDFEVRRVSLAPGASWSVPNETYSLLLTVLGQPEVGAEALPPERAVLIPGGSGDLAAVADSQAAVLLWAGPLLSGAAPGGQ